MDQNVTGLEERIDCHHSEVKKLEDKWEKQQNILQDFLMKVGVWRPGRWRGKRGSSFRRTQSRSCCPRLRSSGGRCVDVMNLLISAGALAERRVCTS